MGFIIMQPATDPVSLKALQQLRSTGENTFDSSLKGPRLRPILFGSRKSTEAESHYHSFVGEVATWRWAISENRVYFWGTHFHWLCDMKTVYKILNYDGPVHTLRRWSQELLAYSFTCVHRPNSMMQDVDALSRYHDPLVAAHISCATMYRRQDMTNRSDAYSSSVFDSLLQSNKYTLNKRKDKSLTAARSTFVCSLKRKAQLPLVCHLASAVECTATPAVTAHHTSLSAVTRSQFEIQLARKWESMIRPQPSCLAVVSACQQSIFVPETCTAPQIIYSTVHFESMPHLKPYCVSLSASAHHVDNTELFLKSYIKHWISINSITGSFATEIAKVLHGTVEITIIEPTSICCDISSITAPEASVFCSSPLQLAKSLTQDDPKKFLHTNKESKYNSSQSIFACKSFDILGLDISFSLPYIVPLSGDVLRHVKDAVFLINTAQRLRGLQVFVMIFPLPSTSAAPLSQYPSDLASYLPNWKISTSRLSTSSHGDHIAASRLFVWGVSSYILLPFTPPHAYLFGTECPQPLSTCMNQNFNSAISSLGSVSTTTLNKS